MVSLAGCRKQQFKLKRSNLTLETKALVKKLIFDGRQCIGVIYCKDGVDFCARAASEVILSAGAFGSPQILMLSGIGPPSHLQDIGI